MDEKRIILQQLLTLEKMRLKNLNDYKNFDDHTIRMCQAHIAHDYFKNRNEWIIILKNEYELNYNDYQIV